MISGFQSNAFQRTAFQAGEAPYRAIPGGGGGNKWRDEPVKVRTGGRSGAKVTINVTDDELRLLYERIMGLRPSEDDAPVPVASKKVQAKVRKAIKDYAVTAQLAAGIVPTQYIDWASVARDMQTVEILFQAAQRAVWDEEDAVMALLLAS